MWFVLGAIAAVIALMAISRPGGLSAILVPSTGTPGAPGATGASGQYGTLPGQTPVTAPQNPVGPLAQQTQQQASAGGFQTLQSLIGIGVSGLTATIGGIGLETGAIAGTSAALGVATAGIGAVAGIAVMLWQQHQLRMKDATNENSAWNIIYPDWMSAIQTIFEAYNTGQIDGPTTIQELQTLRGLVYSDASRFKNMPGIDWSGGMSGGTPLGLTSSQTIWQTPCNRSCTIGCCLFNGVCGPNTNRAIALVGGSPVALFGTGQQQMVQTTSFTVPAIPPNSTYGFNGAPAFTLSVNTVA